jgi:hemolysin III
MSSVPFEVGETDIEESVNALTHAVGVGLSAAVIPLLINMAVERGDAWHIVSVSIYGSTLLLLYVASTFYHACRPLSLKRLLKHVDHASIYLLIAGTYTPFTLITLRGAWGWSLFGVIWASAIAGIVLTIVNRPRFRRLETGLYLLMGWLCLVAAPPLVSRLPALGLMWFALGGLLYTLGVPFYLRKTMPYSHGIWHLFVLAGSVCHFFCVTWYVLSA